MREMFRDNERVYRMIQRIDAISDTVVLQTENKK